MRSTGDSFVERVWASFGANNQVTVSRKLAFKLQPRCRTGDAT